jgi:glucose-1-phosphate adenylyltransferase
MGADYYQPFPERMDCIERGYVPIGIGPDSTIRRAIVDKNARIGQKVAIVNKDNVQEANREELGFVIRSGIVVVLKNATIPDGMVI